ncbi:MAG: hypothetical protein AAGH92_05825 [Planctomycetota bacterium]
MSSRTRRRLGWFALVAAGLSAAVLTGCQRQLAVPDLGGIYERAAQHPFPDRNPVIVIPGILGSRLVHEPDGQTVWGAFTPAAANPRQADELRKLALPMRPGATLAELTDETRTDGALDRIEIEFAKIPIKLDAYANILGTLGAGGYRDAQLGRAGAIDYGDDHYSCFQFPYDWRRDNVENARLLKAYIEEKRVEVQTKHAERFGGEPDDYDVRFDIVAHSMGGLITRYMLRYGDAEPPEVFPDGTVAEPEVTWAGAEHVAKAILVGTPNAGSVASLRQLYQGAQFAPIFPSYPPALLGTMPSVYQLLPRGRHGAVLDTPEADGSRRQLDPLDITFWQKRQWGLADPKQDRVLQMLLPEIESATERRIVALDHLSKSLARAKAFHAALDAPADLPDGLEMFLFAGDAQPTEAVVETDRQAGTLRPISHGPGDGTVLRSSAVLDERVGNEESADWSPRLSTPIDWTHVTFLHHDHLGLTSSTTFSDNVLYMLLEMPTDDE